MKGRRARATVNQKRLDIASLSSISGLTDDSETPPVARKAVTKPSNDLGGHVAVTERMREVSKETRPRRVVSSQTHEFVPATE